MLAITELECVRGERRLFDGLSFDVAPYSLLEVRGANGSGKTSLLRIICGLLLPTAGTVHWNSREIQSLGDEYRGEIAWLGHLNGVKDELTARENLRYSVLTSGLRASETQIDAALHRFGVDGFHDLPCKALSQGQRRRVALARLCLSAPRTLWILDEPFTALDAGALAVATELLESHMRAGGMLVLTTHQEVALAAATIRRVELQS